MSDLANLAFIVGMAVVLPLIARGILRFGRERPVEIEIPPEPDAPPAGKLKPTTVELLRSVGFEPPYGDASDEVYNVHVACVEISNRLCGELGAEAHESGVWPAAPALLSALRHALEDQAGNYGGEDIAYTLVRCGQRGPNVVRRLNPWRRMAFGWRDQGLTGLAIAAMLRPAGLGGELSGEGIAEIDAWIRDPFTALEMQDSVLRRLLGHALVRASLDDSGYEPRHDELFRELAQAASPPVELTEVSQATGPGPRFKDVTATAYVASRDVDGNLTRMHALEAVPDAMAVLSDAGSHWIVEYAHDGKAYGFLANCNATQMDVDAVLRHFDEFMARLGRPDRVFRLRRDDTPTGYFVVADGARFPELARRLGMTLHVRD